MLQASKTLVRVPAASLGALVRTPNRTLTMRSRAPASWLAAPAARSLSTYMREQYLPDSWEIPPLEERSNRVDVSKTRLQRHWDDAAWDEAAVRDAQRSHVNATWGPGNSLDGVPLIKHADGIYVYTSDGKELIDWTSQAVCVNMGHTVPPSVIEAVTKQLETVPMIYSGVGMVEVRARLSALIADLASTSWM